MVRMFFLISFAVVALGALAAGYYAFTNNDIGMLLIVLAVFLALGGLAYSRGLFNNDPAPLKRRAKPDVEAPTAREVAPLRLKARDPEDVPVATSGTEDEIYLVFARLDGVKTGVEFRERINQIAAGHELPQLTAADIDRLAAQIDTKDLKGEAFVRTPGIALARQLRADIDIEYAGTSWLGGIPTLNDAPWPRDEQGRAMHHLAQIDLSTLPITRLPQGLPSSGALSFFMTTSGDGPTRAKVVHLPKIGNTATEPPADLVPVYYGPEWGNYIKGDSRDAAQVTFPRWPVDMIALPMANQNKDDDARELIGDLLPQQSPTSLSPEGYRETNPDFAGPYFWESAHRVVNSLRSARDDIALTIAATEKRVQDGQAKYQASLDTLRDDQPAFSQYVDEVSLWAVSHGPWDVMSATDAVKLQDYFAQVRDMRGGAARFQPFYQYTQCELMGVHEASAATLVAAVNGPPEVFAKLPDNVIDDVDTKYRLAAKDRWHQIFGLGSHPRRAASPYTHHHLLLQLQSDQFLHWKWGDKGALQFWITDEALAVQDWDQVEFTIDAH